MLLYSRMLCLNILPNILHPHKKILAVQIFSMHTARIHPYLVYYFRLLNFRALQASYVFRETASILIQFEQSQHNGQFSKAQLYGSPTMQVLQTKKKVMFRTAAFCHTFSCVATSCELWC